jgi:hypothetical protein
MRYMRLLKVFWNTRSRRTNHNLPQTTRGRHLRIHHLNSLTLSVQITDGDRRLTLVVTSHRCSLSLILQQITGRHLLQAMAGIHLLHTTVGTLPQTIAGVHQLTYMVIKAITPGHNQIIIVGALRRTTGIIKETVSGETHSRSIRMINNFDG